jgi:hypothetical protein
LTLFSPLAQGFYNLCLHWEFKNGKNAFSCHFFVFLSAMKKLTFMLVLCLFYGAAYSQTYLEGAISSGVFLPQHDNSADFPYPYAWSLGMSQQVGSGGLFYNYPRYGAQVMLISLGKPEDTGIGRIYSLQPYLRFSFLKQKYLFNPGLHLAAGVGYMAETLDPDASVANPLLSSRWNAVAAADLDLETRLSPRFFLRTGIGVMHLSSLSKTPESVNMLTATVGLAYVFGGAGDECFPHHNFKKKERSFVNPGKGKRLKKDKSGQECW